jgi:hypothetical protein
MKELQAMSKICSSDILQYCAKVSAGGGRIYDCLMRFCICLLKVQDVESSVCANSGGGGWQISQYLIRNKP